MKTATPRSQFWLDHINQQKTSKQTIKQYVLTHGLNLQSFYTWRSAFKIKPRKSSSKTKASPITFAKVVNADRPVLPTAMRIREAGLVMEFDETPSPEWVHRFLQLRAQKR
jgi:hypothetical protein